MSIYWYGLISWKIPSYYFILTRGVRWRAAYHNYDISKILFATILLDPHLVMIKGLDWFFPLYLLTILKYAGSPRRQSTPWDLCRAPGSPRTPATIPDGTSAPTMLMPKLPIGIRWGKRWFILLYFNPIPGISNFKLLCCL